MGPLTTSRRGHVNVVMTAVRALWNEVSVLKFAKKIIIYLVCWFRRSTRSTRCCLSTKARFERMLDF